MSIVLVVAVVLVGLLTVYSIVLSLRAARVIPVTQTALELAQEARDVAKLALDKAETALQKATDEAKANGHRQ